MSIDGLGGSYGGQFGRAGKIVSSGDEDLLRETKRKRNEALGEHFDRLALATNAMWELLQQVYPGLTVDVLLEKMGEIDARDGVLDSSTHRPATRCPAAGCGAAVPPGLERCQFCGTAIPTPKDPFAF
jgi:hypothetical protein